MTATQAAEATVQVTTAVRAAGLSLFEVAALVTLGLNAVALAFAGYQTLLTRKALSATERTLDLSLRATQVEMLPRAGGVILVQVDFNYWIADLESARRTARQAKDTADTRMLKQVANQGLATPAGLIRQYPYDQMPEWLGTVWVTGAQYYYDAKAPQRHLLNEREDTPRFDFVEDMTSRFDQSLQGIRGLQEIIHDMVPQVYLDSPASIRDGRFFE